MNGSINRWMKQSVFFLLYAFLRFKNIDIHHLNLQILLQMAAQFAGPFLRMKNNHSVASLLNTRIIRYFRQPPAHLYFEGTERILFMGPLMNFRVMVFFFDSSNLCGTRMFFSSFNVFEFVRTKASILGALRGLY